MSTGTQTGDALEAPAAVLDGLVIHDSHAVCFDPDRATCERRSGDGRRVYLVAKYVVEATTPSATGERGLLAHSLVEPIERLRDPDAEARELLADRVADIGGIHQ